MSAGNDDAGSYASQDSGIGDGVDMEEFVERTMQRATSFRRLLRPDIAVKLKERGVEEVLEEAGDDATSHDSSGEAEDEFDMSMQVDSMGQQHTSTTMQVGDSHSVTSASSKGEEWSRRLSHMTQRSTRSSRGPPQEPVGVFWGQKNLQASTQPEEIPSSQHHLVLRTLIAALRSQLVPDDSIPTIFQPPVRKVEPKIFPDSVKKEHSDYFWDLKHQELLDIEKDFEKTYLRDAHLKVEISYPFDRNVSKKPGLNAKGKRAKKKKKKRRKGDEHGNWVELHKKAGTQRTKRVEHLMHLLNQEQLRELERERDLITCTRATRAAVRERVEQERAEAADWMMRIAEDYSIISALTAGEYLHATIEAAAKADEEEVVARRAVQEGLEDELQELKTYKRIPLAQQYKEIPVTGFTQGYSFGDLGPANVEAALRSRWGTTQPTLQPPPLPRKLEPDIPDSFKLGQGTWYATGAAATAPSPYAAAVSQQLRKSKRRSRKQSAAASRSSTLNRSSASTAASAAETKGIYGQSRPASRSRQVASAGTLGSEELWETRRTVQSSGGDGSASVARKSRSVRGSTKLGKSSRRGKTGSKRGKKSKSKSSVRSSTIPRGTTEAAHFKPKKWLADRFAEEALRHSQEATRARLKAERSVPKRSQAVRDIVSSHPRLRPLKRSETAPPDSVGNHHRDEWNGNVMLLKKMTGASSDAKLYSYLTGRRCL